MKKTVKIPLLLFFSCCLSLRALCQKSPEYGFRTDPEEKFLTQTQEMEVLDLLNPVSNTEPVRLGPRTPLQAWFYPDCRPAPDSFARSVNKISSRLYLMTNTRIPRIVRSGNTINDTYLR